MVINGRFLSQPLTGVQRYATEMTRALRRLRPEVRVLAPRNVLHHELAKEFGATTIGKRTGYLWEQLELPRHLRREPSAPLLLNFANQAPVSYRRNVVVIHDLCPFRHPEWYSWRFRQAFRFLVPKIARGALRVVTDSQFSAGELKDVLDLPESRISVVPCAAAAVFQDEMSVRPPLENDYILAVGSFDRRKNLAAVVRAFESLDLPDLKLVVIGRPNRVFSGVAPSDHSHRVVFDADADDTTLRAWYAHARLLVFPSLYEGFGLPPLEAMTCGCPCVISPCGALEETFRDAACYCDPHSPDDIALKMRHLLTDGTLRTKYSERGRQLSRNFSWGRSAELLLAEVDRLNTA